MSLTPVEKFSNKLEAVITQLESWAKSITDSQSKDLKKLKLKYRMAMLANATFTINHFLDIIEPMIKTLSIKYYKANTLEIVDGVLTGGLIGPVIDRTAKADALKEFAIASGVELENTVAIGDGANDLGMMAIAGLSIAFNAKPVVVEAADRSINEPSLRSVIDLIQLL